MSGKLSDRLRLESALDLQRRLPPNMIEAHVAKMIDILNKVVIKIQIHRNISLVLVFYNERLYNPYLLKIILIPSLDGFTILAQNNQIAGPNFLHKSEFKLLGPYRS